MKPTFTIGITGGSGSGKTHFVNWVSRNFDGTELCLVSMDHYYKPREQQAIDENGYKNFDLPTSIDHEAFLRDIRILKSGQPVTIREYTFNNPKASPKHLTFSPAPILILEGLFVQYFKEVEDELDLKIFIDAEDSQKLDRRIRRDKEERGYDLDDVLYRYEHHTLPVYREFIAPLQQGSDLIIQNNANFLAAAEVLTGYLKQKLIGIAN